MYRKARLGGVKVVVTNKKKTGNDELLMNNSKPTHLDRNVIIMIIIITRTRVSNYCVKIY